MTKTMFISENTIMSDSLEDLLFEYLLGEDINRELTALYKGRSQPKGEAFRRSLNETFENGSFVVDGMAIREKRTGDDEYPKNPINARIRQLCGEDAYQRICDAGRLAAVSNLSALRGGIRSALDRMAL